MSYRGQLVYLGLFHVRLFYQRRESVPWCDCPMLPFYDWFYFVGAIFCRWVSRFVWWVDWPILIPFLLLLMWVKYVCCVRSRDVEMMTKNIDHQPMWRMSESTVRFRHFCRLYLSSVIYKILSAKTIPISGFVFQTSSYFCSAFTDAVHLWQPSSWVHWYRCFIVSVVTP